MRLKYTSLVALLYVSFYAQSQILTLQDCIELALEKNISIKQSELDLANAEIDKKKCLW